MPQASRVIRIVRCNGCGRLKDEVTYMIAGPNVYLCERCVAQAARQLAPPRLAPRRLALEAGRCRCCHQRRATGEVTTVGSVIVCADCLGTMTSILAEATQPSRLSSRRDR
jgi:ATP-dependent protease Clp ATPase subunit